jgi:hypothetical protein
VKWGRTNPSSRPLKAIIPSHRIPDISGVGKEINVRDMESIMKKNIVDVKILHSRPEGDPNIYRLLPLRGETGDPLVGLLGILPEEFCICLFALLRKEWPEDSETIDDKIPNMLTNWPVAGIDESIFPKNLP